MNNYRSGLTKKNTAAISKTLSDTNNLIPNEVPSFYTPVKYEYAFPVVHSFTESLSHRRIYYVSDIHIEHQLMPHIIESGLNGGFDFESAIKNRIDKMLERVDTTCTLLIGGDVSSCFDLASIFYKQLFSRWRGRIFSVLGNHELWGAKSFFDLVDNSRVRRSVDEIVLDYSSLVNTSKSFLLENALVVKSYEASYTKLSQSDILQMREEDLALLLSNCSFILLGGVGFSGLNSIYNAEAGLYRNTVSSNTEDLARTKSFANIYDKVVRCAYDRRVIVLTHNPVYDWTDKPCIPNWIYVNGHTHRNVMSVSEDGPCILSDNQVGYKPRDWKLNSFLVDKLWYDPFEKYSDGIYSVDYSQYLEFNRGRGINMSPTDRLEKLIMLKRDKYYVFFTQTAKGLMLYIGAKRKKLPIGDIDYYYNNMVKFAKTVESLIRQYYSVMLQLSEELKAVNCSGAIHGCIIDIGTLSHVYVNPFDGKVTPYWATDRKSRICYQTIQALFDEKHPSFSRSVSTLSNDKSLFLLTSITDSDRLNITISNLSSGSDIYTVSNAIRAMQYVIECKVIRLWSDDILAGNRVISDYCTDM